MTELIPCSVALVVGMAVRVAFPDSFRSSWSNVPGTSWGNLEEKKLLGTRFLRFSVNLVAGCRTFWYATVHKLLGSLKTRPVQTAAFGTSTVLGNLRELGGDCRSCASKTEPPVGFVVR